MKLLSILLLFVLFDRPSFAQDVAIHPVNSNPRLSIEESDWFNQNIKSDSFNFAGKYVGFAQLVSGGYWGIGKWLLPLTKKTFFRLGLNGHNYQLYVLNAEEKRQTNGLDAIVVVASKKIKGKMRRLKRTAVVADTRNRYPQIPDDAGLDSNSLLSSANAAFFNELYKYHNHFTSPFDFSCKKLAIFEIEYTTTNFEQISIPEYVTRVKNQLDENGYFNTEFTYVLTEQQKKEAGGFDVIIQYKCKKGVPLDLLIKQLNNSGG